MRLQIITEDRICVLDMRDVEQWDWTGAEMEEVMYRIRQAIAHGREIEVVDVPTMTSFLEEEV